MDLLYTAGRAISSWVARLAARLDRLIMGAPPKTIAQQVAEATPTELSGQATALNIARAITFKVKDNPPPSPYYLSPDESLLIQITANANGLSVGINGRTLLPDGRIQPFSEVLVLGSSSSSGSFLLALGECFLLDLTFNNQTAGVQLGQIYCNVQVVRGASKASAVLTGNLIEGYIANGYQLFWPNGLVVPMNDGPCAVTSQAVTNPAAGADFSVTVPSQQRWRLRAVTGKLTTAVAAANRRAALQITDGTNLLFTIAPSQVQAASLAWTYSFGSELGAEVNASADLFLAEPLPDLLLEAGFVVKSNTVSIQGADQWSLVTLLFDLWIHG